MEFQVVLPCGGSFNIHLKSKELRGKHLIHNIYQNVKVAEETRDYFGICYADKEDGGKNWIKPDDNLKHLNSISAGRRVQLQFEVRIFPKDPDLIFPTADSRKVFRQHMKNLLTNNQIGCENKTYAMLDAFIVQAELGDYQEGKNYFQKVNDIEIYAPTSLCSGSPLTETEYLKLMRMYHKKLHGMSNEQADILYLSLVQKIPLYGYTLYHIADKEHKEHYIALSSDGIHFIYESCMEKFLEPQKKETINWLDLVYCEVINKKIKVGYTLPRNTNGLILEKYFKIKNKYTHKGASRFKADLNKYKEMFTSDKADGGMVFNTRKEAEVCYSTQLPRRANTLGNRMNSIRNSIKIKGKMRVSTAKVNTQELRPVASVGNILE